MNNRPITKSKTPGKHMITYTETAILAGPYTQVSPFQPPKWTGTIPGNTQNITIPNAKLITKAPSIIYTETGLKTCHAAILKEYINHLQTTTTAAQIMLTKDPRTHTPQEHHGTWDTITNMNQIAWWYKEGTKVLNKLKQKKYRPKDW